MEVAAAAVGWKIDTTVCSLLWQCPFSILLKLIRIDFVLAILYFSVIFSGNSCLEQRV